jgi:hypothetical protein
MSIDIYYYSFSPERADKHWENFSKDLEQCKQGVDFKPEDNVDVGELTTLADPKYSNNESQISHSLRQLDLTYGSVSCWPMDSPKCEYNVVGVLAKIAGVPYEDGYITKENLIKVFENIKFENYMKAIKLLAEEMKWDDGDSEDTIYEYLGNVRPVALDLKQNPETMFIMEVNGEICPDEAGELIKQRVKDHLKIFKETLT